MVGARRSDGAQVNYEGTLNVIAACRFHGCKKLIYSSSPSTRFDGSDVDGLNEAQMPAIPQRSYLQEYAKTKAMGEVAVREACGDELMTVAIAPHQVQGRMGGRCECIRAGDARRGASLF